MPRSQDVDACLAWSVGALVPICLSWFTDRMLQVKPLGGRFCLGQLCQLVIHMVASSLPFPC